MLGCRKTTFVFIYIFAVRRYNAFLHAMTAHGRGGGRGRGVVRKYDDDITT
jgi:hypothetical protein